MNRRHLTSDICVILLLLAVALVFRFYQIGQIPPGLFPDEATHALDAQEVLDGQLTVYSPDEGSTGALWRYLLALFFRIVSPSILSLRAFASAIGVLSVGMAYLTIRELNLGLAFSKDRDHQLAWSEVIAALAALLIGVSYWHVSLSRIALSAVLMLLIQDATFFSMWRGVKSGRIHWFILFGVGMGVLLYNYLPGKLVPAIPMLFLLFQWVIARRDAVLIRHWRSWLVAGAVALFVSLPLVLFALLNFQMLLSRAAVPPASVVAPPSLVQTMLANLAAFGLWPTPWLEANWGRFFLGLPLTLCFVVGVGISLARTRKDTARDTGSHLFLLIWWIVMLLPSVLAPEGAIPHTRRAIGTVTPTFALMSVGLVVLVSAPFWAVSYLSLPVVGRIIKRPRPVALLLTLVLGLFLIASTGTSTFRRYFAQWGTSEAARLAFHVYDLELADLMAHQSGPETVYLLPRDSSAGIVNPLLDSIDFVYQGQASYDFLSDNEQTMLAQLSRLTAGKQVVRLLRWNVTKHTGADPKGVAHYYLEKWGRWIGTESYPYFDIDTYDLDNTPDAFTSVQLTHATIRFEGQMALSGHAFGGQHPSPLAPKRVDNGPSVEAGGWIWTELAWRKTGGSSVDYHVALWLEDQAGHEVGRADKPLLNNLWHQGTSAWETDKEEHDYYLLPVEPATSPGLYRLKAVIYAEQEDSRRLAPELPGAGADLAVTLGEIMVYSPPTPPDMDTLPIPQRLDREVADGLRLVGYSPGFADPLHPGQMATLSLWWQATQPLSQNLAVTVGIRRGDRAWPLSEPLLLGGSSYPTRHWQTGTVVRTYVDLRVPAGAETGDYDLEMRILNAEGAAPLGDWLLGQIRLVARTRSFDVPPITHKVAADFGGQVTLLGYDIEAHQTEEEGVLRLVLYWQAQTEMETAYKVFVHLLDETGQIVAQVDQAPVKGTAPTTGWLANEVVLDVIDMPISDAIASTGYIAIGLYDPRDGRRLQIAEAAPPCEKTSILADHLLIDVRTTTEEQ